MTRPTSGAPDWHTSRGASGWCLAGQHSICIYGACACACHLKEEPRGLRQS